MPLLPAEHNSRPPRIEQLPGGKKHATCAKVGYGPPSATLGTPFIPRGQHQPGARTQGRLPEGTPRPPSRPGPQRRAPGGARGSAGGAGPQPGMSSAAQPSVAGRLHQTPRGAAAHAAGRAGPSRRAGRLGPGRVSSGRAQAHASGRLRRGLLLPVSSPASPPPPYLRLQPARPQAASTPSGPARRGPTRPRPRSPRVSEEERRLRNRQPPPVPPPPPASPPRGGRTLPPPPPRPMGGPACGRRARPSRRTAPPANRERPGCGRRARGGGVDRGAAGWAGVAAATLPGVPPPLARGGGPQLLRPVARKGL